MGLAYNIVLTLLCTLALSTRTHQCTLLYFTWVYHPSLTSGKHPSYPNTHCLRVRRNVVAHPHWIELKKSQCSWEGIAPTLWEGCWLQHTFIMYKFRQAVMSKNGDGGSGWVVGPRILLSHLQRGPKAQAYFSTALHLLPRKGEGRTILLRGTR